MINKNKQNIMELYLFIESLNKYLNVNYAICEFIQTKKMVVNKNALNESYFFLIEKHFKFIKL